LLSVLAPVDENYALMIIDSKQKTSYGKYIIIIIIHHHHHHHH